MAAIQGAIGELARLREHVAQAIVAARRARAPLLALRARVTLLERLAAAGRAPEHRRIAARLMARRLAGVPPLLRARVQSALAGPSPATTTDADMRRQALQFVRRSGARALDAPPTAAPPGDVIQDLVDVMRICYETEDERAALTRLCMVVRERTRALSVGVFPAGSANGPLSFAGSLPRGRPRVAERVIETSLAVPPGQYGDGLEAAAPVRYGGETVAALAGRWTGELLVGADRVTALLAGAAAACAPGVRAALDRRVDAGASDERDVGLLGRSTAMDALRRMIARAAAAPFAVLIEGESGSGKELVARAIHAQSGRRLRPLCAVNCAALSDELLEAELFGHVRGAFTGAASDRRGLFEEADGSTLFLDEISELSPRAQAKLLRAIQEREVRRIGENLPRRVDVRLIVASNRSLSAEAAAGRFRSDLWYRLDVVRVSVPALRERADDVPLLANHFWTGALAATGGRATLDPEVLACLARYDWPGNVRELQNVMAALAVHAPRRGRVGPSALPAAIAGATASGGESLEAARRHFEQRFVRAALARAGGYRSRAASDLGLTRQGLAKLLKRLGLEEV